MSSWTENALHVELIGGVGEKKKDLACAAGLSF